MAFTPQGLRGKPPLSMWHAKAGCQQDLCRHMNAIPTRALHRVLRHAAVSRPACLSHDRPMLPKHCTTASRSADRPVLGWVTCSQRSQELKYLFPCIGLHRPDGLGWGRGGFVDPPGGHRTGVESPKPRCRARGCLTHCVSAHP